MAHGDLMPWVWLAGVGTPVDAVLGAGLGCQVVQFSIRVMERMEEPSTSMFRMRICLSCAILLTMTGV